MANRYGDPRVKEWMKTHEGEVAKIQVRYDQLKEVGTLDLVDLAEQLSGVDFRKIRATLITAIIAAEAKRV